MTPLTLDDPLSSTTQPQAPAKTAPEEKPPVTPPTPPKPARRGGGKARTPTPASSQADGGAADGAWRSWGAGTRVQSYKLPDQLIGELDARTTALNLPIGMTVAAGVVAALDLGDDELISLVERAEEARERGRRAARRQH